MNDSEVYEKLGEISSDLKTLNIRMVAVEASVKDAHNFFAKWRFGFAFLVGVCTVGAAVIGMWNGLTAFVTWMQFHVH